MLPSWNAGIARPNLTRTALVLIAVWMSQQLLAAEDIPGTFAFPDSGVRFHADFDGARLDEIAADGPGRYRAVMRAENEPINNSPWYAFRVTADVPQTLTIHLTYAGGSHRYQPKISVDGANWQRLAADRVTRDKGSATLRIDTGPDGVWIAAQEMVGAGPLNDWIDQLAELPDVEVSEIGRSVGDRPIRQLTISPGDPEFAVAIIGRQHPPEITGSLALMEFVQTIVGPGQLAERFRETFETAVIPLVNPDGVAAGNWRHNLHGVDLNRDWGPFRQPETRAVRDAILQYRDEDAPRLAFFLDFHSTHHDVFYVQTGDQPVWPDRFSQRWLDTLAERLPEYRVRQEPSSADRPLSKVWARQTMQVPAVIYEVGDTTDRELIRRVARTAAQTMMRMLLAEVPARQKVLQGVAN
jgi:hypothetical protein